MRPRRNATIRSTRSKTCRGLWLTRINGTPRGFLHTKRRRAGDGSALPLPARLIEDRVINIGGFHRRGFQGFQRAGAHGLAIRHTRADDDRARHPFLIAGVKFMHHPMFACAVWPFWTGHISDLQGHALARPRQSPPMMWFDFCRRVSPRGKRYANFAAEYARLQQMRIAAMAEFVTEVDAGDSPRAAPFGRQRLCRGGRVPQLAGQPALTDGSNPPYAIRIRPPAPPPEGRGFSSPYARSSTSTASTVGRCRAISCHVSPSSRLANTDPELVPK